MRRSPGVFWRWTLACVRVSARQAFAPRLIEGAPLLGLQFALMRARARGLDANRVMDLGISIIIRVLVGAKRLLLVGDFDASRRSPGELFTLPRPRGVFCGIDRRRRH